MILRLKRFSYSPTETEGVLTFSDGTQLATIEQPWVPNPNGAKGGKPFSSCVPDGMYKLLEWTRPSGAQVYLMYNPELGVHKLPDDHPDMKERDLCLFHTANFVTDIEGCCGPGLVRSLLLNRKTGEYERAVSSSGAAMMIMREKLAGEKVHILSIESTHGANDVSA